jgi:hypothetical protein
VKLGYKEANDFLLIAQLDGIGNDWTKNLNSIVAYIGQPLTQSALF